MAFGKTISHNQHGFRVGFKVTVLNQSQIIAFIGASIWLPSFPK